MFLYFPSRFTTITSRNFSVTSRNFGGCGFAGITELRINGIMEALPRQQDNEYGGSRLVVSWSCSLRSIIRHPAPKIYLLYSLYHLYQSPSTHPILLNSVSSLTLTAYTHYGLVLQRYEYLRYHCPVMSGYVHFLFVKS